MLFFTFNTLLFQHSSAQDKADSLALSLAASINENDRIGQLNQLQACSRELIFESRQQFDQCRENDLDFLQPLCAELLSESRRGQSLLEQERKNQIKVICTKLQEQAGISNKISDCRNPFKLICLSTSEAQIWKIEVGKLKKLQSSVKCGISAPELESFDKKQQYCMFKSRLYKSGTNARLPGADGDLDFIFTALPARVESICAPARNVNQDAFVYEGTIFDDREEKAAVLKNIPTAVRVICRMTAELDDKQSLSIPLISTGSAGGAALEP